MRSDSLRAEGWPLVIGNGWSHVCGKRHVGQPGINPNRDLTATVPFARLTTAAAKTNRVQEEVRLTDRNGKEHGFIAEAWFNQHVHFLMLVPKQRVLRGRRIRTVTLGN